jgi:hypothetical protein
LELLAVPQLQLANLTTTILAVIQSVIPTLENNIYYYKELGVIEVDLTTVECVVGRIWDQGRWAIVDRSDNIRIQVD